MGNGGKSILECDLSNFLHFVISLFQNYFTLNLQEYAFILQKEIKGYGNFVLIDIIRMMPKIDDNLYQFKSE